MELNTLLAIIIPIAIIDVAIRTFTIIDFLKTSENRSKESMIGWILIIGLVTTFGWLAYLLFGRIPKEKKKYEETWD